MIIDDKKRLAQVIDEYVTARLYSTHVMLPGKVISYDSDTQSASVQIMTKYISEITGAFDNTDDLIINKVPVVFPGSADDCGMTFPISAGTLGVLNFADWSLAQWAFGNGSDPADIGTTNRCHELRDATFIPGLRPFSRKYDFYDSSNVVIKNSNGTNDITMSLKPTGKFSLANDTGNELLAVIQELIVALESATVVTALGPSPFTPTTLTALGNAKTKLQTFI